MTNATDIMLSEETTEPRIILFCCICGMRTRTIISEDGSIETGCVSDPSHKTSKKLIMEQLRSEGMLILPLDKKEWKGMEIARTLVNMPEPFSVEDVASMIIKQALMAALMMSDFQGLMPCDRDSPPSDDSSSEEL